MILVLGKKPIEDLVGVFITSLDSIKVQDCQTSKLAHCDGESHINNPIHGAGQYRNGKGNCSAIFARDLEGGVDLLRVDGYGARD